jgi:hypothetical protein
VAALARLLSATALIGILAGAGVASAAAIPTTARTLGGGTASVGSCDGNGFAFAATIDTSERITAVTVSGIDTSCAGAVLRVTLASGTTSVGSGSVTLPSSGFSGSATVTISPTPVSTGVDRIFAVAEGQ